MNVSARMSQQVSLGVVALLWGCSSAPQVEKSMTLGQAGYPVAWVTGMDDDAGAMTLSVALGVAGNASPCPVVDQATASVNGLAMVRESPGKLGQQCVYNGEGICNGSYEPVCYGPSWSLVKPPPGPLAIVLRDPSGAFEVDVGDMGTPRSLSVSSVTDGTPGAPGQVTLTWSPPSDPVSGWAPTGPIYGHTSDQFGITDIRFVPDPALGSGTDPGLGTLEWYGGGSTSFPQGVTVHGAQITISAANRLVPSTGGGASPPAVGPGAFTVQAYTLVPTTRCDWANCEGNLVSSASVSASWSPF